MSDEFRNQLRSVYGLSDTQITALEQLGLESEEELAQINEEVLASIQMPTLKAKALIAKIQAASTSQVTIEAEVSVDTTATEEPFDPFASIDNAMRAGTARVYDPEQIVLFRNAMRALGPELAGLPTTLRGLMRERGLRGVKNGDLADVLTEWMDLDPSAGGKVTIPASQALGTNREFTVTVLSASRRQEVVTLFLNLLQGTDLDDIFFAAAAYHRQGRKAVLAQRSGATVVGDTTGLDDPDSLKDRLERGLAQITRIMNNGILGPSIKRLAMEHSQIILRAFTDADVVRAFNVTVLDGDNPFNRFLNSPGDQYEREIAALEFSGAASKALGVLTTYDAGADIDEYLLQLGAPGQEFLLATRHFAMQSPAKPQVQPGQQFGLASAIPAFKAMLNVSVKVGADGRVEVKTTASVQVDASPLRLRGADLKNALTESFNIDELKELVYSVQSRLRDQFPNTRYYTTVWNYDDIPGDTRVMKAMSIAALLQRIDNPEVYSAFAIEARTRRPNVQW